MTNLYWIRCNLSLQFTPLILTSLVLTGYSVLINDSFDFNLVED